MAGSEDGDLTILKVPSGEVLSKKVFNPVAQRGISNIAIHENSLIVVNCLVKDDFNLWGYEIEHDTFEIKVIAKINLQINSDRKQVHSFALLFD